METILTVAFVYDIGIKILPVYMNDSSVALKEAQGMTIPLYILFNATGEG